MAAQKDVIPGFSPSKAAFARYLVRSLILKDIQKVPLTQLSEEIVSHAPPKENGLPEKSGKDPDVAPGDLTVGIVGAGISGLYTALILQSLGIKYEILEANPKRIGGRLYTHYFSDPNAEGNESKHDYYDIGAMRFPKTPIMERTFKLFDLTKTELGEYRMKAEKGHQPMRYNDITKVLPPDNQWQGDPFKVSTLNKGPVPPESVADPDTILNDAYFPYRHKIKRALNQIIKHNGEKPKDPEDEEAWKKWNEEDHKLNENLERAWNYLMKHDQFSLRDYLSFVEGQDDETIHWLETLNSATGWFDQAFSENILESLAFEYTSKTDETDNPDPAKPGEDVKWNYIVNGTYKLTENTLALLDKKPEQGKLVTSMALAGEDRDRKIEVKVADELEPRVYDSVVTTTTFSALQKMDLERLNLPYATKTAIRSLRYDASTKVAIKFAKPWWIDIDETKEIEGAVTGIRGGLGKTDLPLRTCVYPSYNLEDGRDSTAVLLCSYSWGSDSERIASMVNPVPSSTTIPQPVTTQSSHPRSQSEPQPQPAWTTSPEAALVATMIDNLARLHSTTSGSYTAMHALISRLYVTHHAYDWSKDPYTCGGAFALYSPAQFRTLYPHVVRPVADSRVHIVGEAASAHHAWIVGALDSAVRGVYLLLERFRFTGQGSLQERLVREWGEVGEVDGETAYLQVALGMLGREGRR